MQPTLLAPTQTVFTLLLPICMSLAACGGGGASDAPVSLSAASDTTVTASATTASIEAVAGLDVLASAAATLTETAIAAESSTPAMAAQAVALVSQAREELTSTATATAAATRREVYVDAANARADDKNAGTQAAPLKTIARAMAMLRPGDDVIVGPGVYREGVVIPSLAGATVRTTLRAATPGTTVIKGSAVVKDFSASGLGTQIVAWPVEPAMVLVNGVPLQQVEGTVFGGYPFSGRYLEIAKSQGQLWPGRRSGSPTTMAAGSFFYDTSAKLLHIKPIATLQSADLVEVSNQRHVLKGAAAEKFTVQGITFEHANTSIYADQGALLLEGNDIVVNNVEVRNVDSFCVQLQGNRNQLLNSRLTRCGQVGINAGGDAVLIQGNTVTEANWRGFNKWWAAGGMKLVGSPKLTNSFVRANTVYNNAGDGIWIDWLQRANTIEDNVSAYNTGFGIHYEASSFGVIRRNRVYGNAQRGIYLNLASDTLVERNSVFLNAMEGVAVVLDDRVTTDPSFSPNRNIVRFNSIAWNDQGRNYIQLIVPLAPYSTESNNNQFASAVWKPRMNQGWMSNQNPPAYGLDAWRSRTGQDGQSLEIFAVAPAAIAAAVSARRLLTLSELPIVLRFDSLK